MGCTYNPRMAITVQELIEKLAAVPDTWKAESTRAGGSIEVWDPDGDEYGYVFTGPRPTKLLKQRSGRER